MLTPKPFSLNLVVMGDSQVAFDAVCCAIVGVDPREVEHIRLAEEHGFGTTDLSSIAISGDVSLEEAKRRAEGFEVGLVRVEKYFEGTKITAYAGPPPERERTDYCWGGCPGAIEEAIEILRLVDPRCDEKMPRLHVVFGAYDGPIDAKPGERVVFIGDCAEWKGELHGRLVQINSRYQPREGRDPHAATHHDLYAKMLEVSRRLSAAKKGTHLRLEGCPVSVSEQVLALVSLAGTKNPYFVPSEVVKFNRSYFAWKAHQARQRLMGRPYQKSGPVERGEAAPILEAPAETG
jgi:hypothetical protein